MIVRSLALALSLLLASCASAASLLAELTWNQPEPVTLPAMYGIQVRGEFLSHAWQSNVTEHGSSIFIDPALVKKINWEFTDTTSEWRPQIAFFVVDAFGHQQHVEGLIHCGTCSFPILFGNREWLDANDPFGADYWAEQVTAEGWEVERHAPLLSDFGFRGYVINQIEQITSEAGQTIRFYGGLAPEPSSLLLMLLGCILHITTVRQGVGRQSCQYQ